jgi:hypothetical protein
MFPQYARVQARPQPRRSPLDSLTIDSFLSRFPKHGICYQVCSDLYFFVNILKYAIFLAADQPLA